MRSRALPAAALLFKAHYILSGRAGPNFGAGFQVRHWPHMLGMSEIEIGRKIVSDPQIHFLSEVTNNDQLVALVSAR
jgi:hypothetical protein